MVKPLFVVKVLPPVRNANHDRREWCTIHLDKTVGCMAGACTWAFSKAEALATIREFIERESGYDSILGRVVGKATMRNTEFESFTGELRKAELFGSMTLASFFGKAGKGVR